MKKTKRYLLGIDLGGTQLRFILADYETGNITNLIDNKISRISYDSPLCDKKSIFSCEYFSKVPDNKKISLYVVRKIKEYIEYLGIKKNTIKGIGISVAGKIQNDHRFIGSNVPLKYADKIGVYYGVDLITGIKEIFQKNTKIEIENDANCSGMVQALYYKHMGINPETTFFITVSTGIGGGGLKRDLDEIGHIIVDGYFPKLVTLCGCGAAGCIETYASGEGIENQTMRILNYYFNDRETFNQLNKFEYIRSEKKYNLRYIIGQSRLKQLYIEKKEITAERIFNFSNMNCLEDTTDRFALYLVEVAAERIAKVLVSLSNIHGVERYGFGGSVVIKNPKFLDIIQENISKIYKGSKDIFKNKIIIEISPLGEYVNDYGALFLVVDPVYEKKWIDSILKMLKKSKKIC